jgi:transposase
VRAIQIQLTPEDKQFLEGFRSKGEHRAREVTRAHILLALAADVPAHQVERVLGVSRKVVWRTLSAYREKGVDYAVYDAARPGQPVKYARDQLAEVAALAGSQPPDGATRWTLRSLTIAARHLPKLEGVSHETIRQILRKSYREWMCDLANHGVGPWLGQPIQVLTGKVPPPPV